MGLVIAISLWRCLRAGLYAHTAQALGAGPVSAALPNAKMSEPGFV